MRAEISDITGRKITTQPPKRAGAWLGRGSPGWGERVDAGELGRARPQARIFATELVKGGQSIHIGAALLEHLNIQTTRGCVAVFDEDVIRHYQAHLQHRRQARPDDEYIPVTESEWAEFEEHFDKRKVEVVPRPAPMAPLASTSAPR